MDDDQPVMGETVCMMTDDEVLMIGCPIAGCPWCAPVQTQWSPLVTFLDVKERLMPHLSRAHAECLVDWDDLEERAMHIAPMVGFMRANLIAGRDGRCMSAVLHEGNEESDGLLKFALRSAAEKDGSADEFDEWWADVEQHAARERFRQKAQTMWTRNLLNEMTQFLKKRPGESGDEERPK